MSNKRRYGKGKTNRKSFRFTPQVAELVENMAKQLRISENELVSDAVFMHLSDSNNFLTCPSCNTVLLQKYKINVSGVCEVDCHNCNSKIWWDVDEDRVLKVK